MSASGRAGLFARDEPQLIGRQADQAEEVFLKVTPERCGVVGVDSQVFVHVERDDARPVDGLVGNEAAP